MLKNVRAAAVSGVFFFLSFVCKKTTVPVTQRHSNCEIWIDSKKIAYVCFQMYLRMVSYEIKYIAALKCWIRFNIENNPVQNYWNHFDY